MCRVPSERRNFAHAERLGKHLIDRRRQSGSVVKLGFPLHLRMSDAAKE